MRWRYESEGNEVGWRQRNFGMNGYSWKGLVLFSQESKGKGKGAG